MTGTLRVPRSRGALSGTLLVLLGLWGGLIPFVGPYADFAYTPDRTWAWTSGRLWLEVLPAVATVLGGLILLASANRAIAMLGGWLAALGGAWFAVGTPLSMLWTSGHLPAAGTPVGSIGRQVAEQIAFFTGLGVVTVFFAALALGRLAVVGVRDRALSEPYVREYEPTAEPEPHAPGRDPAEPPTAPYPRPPGAGRYARPSEPESTPFQPERETSPGPVDEPAPSSWRKRAHFGRSNPEKTDQKVAGRRTGD